VQELGQHADGTDQHEVEYTWTACQQAAGGYTCKLASQHQRKMTSNHKSTGFVQTRLLFHVHREIHHHSPMAHSLHNSLWHKTG
jgi:hypothetical protein